MRVAIAILILLSFPASVAAYAAKASGENSAGVTHGDYVFNAGSQEAADRQALQACGRRGLRNCRIIVRWNNTCVALGEHAGVEVPGFGETSAAARASTLFRCPRCAIIMDVCDTGPPQPTTMPLGRYVLTRLWAFSSRPENSAYVFIAIGAASFALIVALGLRSADSPQPAPISYAPALGARFQARLKHTQEHSGFYIEITLLFTQDSINLIKARRLEDYVVITGRTHAPYSWLGARVLVYGWRVVGILAVFAAFGSFFVGIAGYDIAGVMLVGGIIAVIVAWLAPKKAIDAQGIHEFTIGNFMRKSTVRLWSPNGLLVKDLDNDIREKLQTLRLALDASVNLPQSETFDV